MSVALSFLYIAFIRLFGPVMRVDASGAADQNTERSRIEEVDTLQVDNEVLVAGGAIDR